MSRVLMVFEIMLIQESNEVYSLEREFQRNMIAVNIRILASKFFKNCEV